MTTRPSPASGNGTPDAQPGRMKDFVVVAATVAFFAVAWLYAKSFDHL
ncbi:MAG TPA: hypothetical protein VGK52_04100 [Polyangia bacterium]|jgi:hypothetical protein